MSKKKTSKSASPLAELGSISYPYKLLIIGGGPSGCSVIVRAIRIGMLDDLCGGNDDEGGICIIDKDDENRFGGGRLQDYLINSNTWANKFVSNVLSDKSNVIPKESVTGSILERLQSNSKSAKELEQAGNKQAPLTTVGSFLRDVGQSVREAISKYPATSTCLVNTSVTAIERCRQPEPPTSHPLSKSKISNKIRSSSYSFEDKNSDDDDGDDNGDSGDDSPSNSVSSPSGEMKKEKEKEKEKVDRLSKQKRLKSNSKKVSLKSYRYA